MTSFSYQSNFIALCGGTWHEWRYRDGESNHVEEEDNWEHKWSISHNHTQVYRILKKEQESAFSFYHLKAEIVVTAALQSTLGF